jgi:hypothetical protein
MKNFSAIPSQSSPGTIIINSSRPIHSQGSFLIAAALLFALSLSAVPTTKADCQCAIGYFYGDSLSGCVGEYEQYETVLYTCGTDCAYDHWVGYCETDGDLVRWNEHSSCGAPPPVDTVSITQNEVICVGTGVDGWCRGGATLYLTAADTLSHGITFSDDVSGGNPLSVSLGEGEGTIDFTATCSEGRTATGSNSYRLDLTAPIVTPFISGGTPGNAPWVTGGTVTLSCTVWDALSGGNGVTYGTNSVSGNGIVPVTCTGSDRAGNTAGASGTVYYDGTPPVITGTVGGTPVSGWYNGSTSLSCTATDATSGLANIFYGVMTATTAGPTTLDCTAVDVAGNSSTYSTVVQVDNVLPTAAFSFNGNYCANDWYNSPVYVGMAVHDAHSGPAGGRFLVDGAEWDSSQPIQDGEHVITALIADLAGNTASPSVTLKVDTHPPFSSFTTKNDSWFAGNIALEGDSIDWTSGISQVDISFDNGVTWTTIASSSHWSYDWNTLPEGGNRVPDGDYTVLVRAKDNACNWEHTGRVTVHVDNTPPDLSITDSLIVLGRSTNVSAVDLGSGVDHGFVTISGNGIEPKIINFVSSTQVSWDGYTGDGKEAPFGTYDVKVDVWDKVGNHSTTSGTWLRPKPEQNPVPSEPVPPSLPSLPVQPPVSPSTDSALTAVVTKGLPFWGLLLPFMISICLLFVNSIPFISDRRWSEVNKLQREIIRHRKSTQSLEGEIHD